MKYKFSLRLGEHLIKEQFVNHRGGPMEDHHLKKRADDMFLKAITTGRAKRFAYYQGFNVTVLTISTGIERRFLRQPGTIGSGFHPLWVEEKTPAIDTIVALGSGDESLMRNALNLPAVQVGKRRRPGR